MAFDNEEDAGFWALINLERALPPEPMETSEWYEAGTQIYRWKDEKGTFQYDFQWPLYSNHDKDGHWQPAGKVPIGAEIVAACHTHPNNGFFSNIDTATARGERGLVKQKIVMYMVNRIGAYSYDGKTANLSETARYHLLWGKYPEKKK